MKDAAYAAVDWGTSSFRLWFVDAMGRVVAERRSQEGMVAAGKLGFPAVLRSHLDAVGAAERLPVIICGMAGARQGWVEAGYVDTPAPLGSVSAQAVSVPGQCRDVRILPGIAQREFDAPDVMRGEETQLLGAFGPSGIGDGLVCMPGTHSKWVTLRAGTVTHFATFMTGELFGAISRETILSHAVAGAPDALDHGAFRSAVLAAFDAPATTANLLFRVRSRQLLFGGSPSAARETISGTLIGLELAAGLAQGVAADGVILLAAAPLATLYQAAFDALSVQVQRIDADAAVLCGLSRAAAAIWNT
jgi:2-dehydro-3-deoxygalactonokinase